MSSRQPRKKSSRAPVVGQVPTKEPSRKVKKAPKRLNKKKAAWSQWRKEIPYAILDGCQNGRANDKWPKAVQSTESKGLLNPSNMCYRIGVLQCLLHMPTFYNYLGNMHKQCHLPDQTCDACHLQALFNIYWNDTTVVEKGKEESTALAGAMNDLHQAFFNTIPDDDMMFADFKDLAQADSFEFFRYLARRMRIVDERAETSHASTMQVMAHEVHDGWTCEDCQNKKGTRRNSIHAMDVGVTVPFGEGATNNSVLRLVDLLQGVFREVREVRCEAETCASSMTHEERSKDREWKTSFTQAPHILVLQLGRFKQDYQSQYGLKLGTRILFDETLDLSEHVDDEADFPDGLKYRLDGVVFHIGKTLDGGHYVAGVRMRGGNQFAMLSDLEPPVVGSFEEVMQASKYGKRKADAYLLFYSRMT